MCQYSWAVMKTGANTRGHSDRKVVCPALPTDSCDSWTEAWSEEFSHLQVSPVSPAWTAHCSLWRWQQLLAKIQKTDMFCSSLASRTGCTHPASDSTDSAACSAAGNWTPIHPQTVFSCWLPPSGDWGEDAHCYPTLPCQRVPMWATQMSEHQLLLTLFQ